MTKRKHEVFWRNDKHPSEIKKDRPDAKVLPDGTGQRNVRHEPEKEEK